MAKKDYYPLNNSGETIINSSKRDPTHLYYNSPTYTIAPMLLIADFELQRKPNHWYGEFILFEIDGKPDFQVLTSLN